MHRAYQQMRLCGGLADLSRERVRPDSIPAARLGPLSAPLRGGAREPPPSPLPPPVPPPPPAPPPVPPAAASRLAFVLAAATGVSMMVRPPGASTLTAGETIFPGVDLLACDAQRIALLSRRPRQRTPPSSAPDAPLSPASAAREPGAGLFVEPARGEGRSVAQRVACDQARASR